MKARLKPVLLFDDPGLAKQIEGELAKEADNKNEDSKDESTRKKPNIQKKTFSSSVKKHKSTEEAEDK
ncbi:MAG: hypothetical protein ACOX9R_08570 [Armatimonadota bacterium]